MNSTITLINVTDETNIAKIDYIFFLPLSSILEYDTDTNLNVMFVLSNSTAEGKTGAIIHFFTYFNIFGWDSSLDLEAELGTTFRFRDNNALTYSSEL